jgi:hypothetical protein
MLGMRAWGIAAGAAAVIVGVVGCGGSGGGRTAQSPSQATTAAPTTTGVPAASVAAKYRPQLDQLSAGDACQRPSLPTCALAVHDTLAVLAQLTADIPVSDPPVYHRSLPQIQKMTKAAGAYTSGGCLGNSAANVAGSPCFTNALAVTGGVSVLETDLDADERTAGIG